jgi:cyanophycin synthetase
MDISVTHILRGPNQWSEQLQQLIVMKVAFTTEESGARKQTVAKNPPLSASFEKKNENEVLSQLILCIGQLQSAVSETECEIRTLPSHTPHEHIVLVPYENERTGLQVCKSAILLLNELISGQTSTMDREMELLRKIRRRSAIGPTSNYILNEIKRRDIPFKRFAFGSLMILGYGLNQKKIRTAVTDETSGLGIEIAGDKEETKYILEDANCPVPAGMVVDSEEELRERLQEVAFPLVVKPLDGNHGRGVTTNINSVEGALNAFRIAARISSSVILEEFLEGADYRFLVIDFKLIAVARRVPATITGNGVDTIKDLIERENLHKDRGADVEHVLAKIKIDAATEKILAQQSYTLESILAFGQGLVLKDTANISAGGTAEDVTHEVHPFNRFLTERIARLFNLNICGVDIVAKDVSKPLARANGAVIEVNAGPGLRMHSNPQKGTARDIASPIVDLLFKNRQEALIPIVAITGTNGKTTTTRLIAHLAEVAGKRTGYCCSDGIYSNGWKIRSGDCTGATSAGNVLHDPLINFAVLECARGGIIRSGLGFTNCDVAVVTNVSEDHLDQSEIRNLDELARLKSVLVRSVYEHGYGVLNAEDELVMSMKTKLRGRAALFSLEVDNKHLQEHLMDKGIAAFIKNGRALLCDKTVFDLGAVTDFPMSFGGTADFMTRNLLAGSLAAFCSGIPGEVIREGLLSFTPDEVTTPGRMNHFRINQINLYLDYAHNLDGFKAISHFIGRQEAAHKRAVIAVAGDRREEDIVEMGRLVATVFDEVIIRYNLKERGIGNKEVCELLKKGCALAATNSTVLLIEREETALRTVIDKSSKNDLIFVCADRVEDSLALIEKLKEVYRNSSLGMAGV